MISINLIDWRSQRILILNRRFGAAVGVAIVAWLLVAGLIYLAIYSQINLGQNDVKYIDDQLKEVAGALTEIKGIQDQKNLLLSRRETIQQLQASRPLAVLIFDNIARIMPAGVVLNQFARKGDEVIISGSSDSNYNISLLMENAQKLTWVKSAKLGELKNTAGGGTTSARGGSATAAPSGQVSFEMHLMIDTEKYGVQSATKTTTN